jgi:predicted negative regulator of RcsB-dependent stress response
MDEDTLIIDTKTRNDKIKNFLIENKKKIISSFFLLILILLGFYSFQIFKESQKERLSEKYNSAIIKNQNTDKSQIILTMKEVIENRDTTYSPLALYYIIDNDLIIDTTEINRLFDILINDVSLKNEVKNLIIYKKGLYNADITTENKLLKILNPLINSNSVWKSHALYLVAEYFYSKNEKVKSKEFFYQILNLENANQDLKKEAQKRLNRDLSD